MRICTHDTGVSLVLIACTLSLAGNISLINAFLRDAMQSMHSRKQCLKVKVCHVAVYLRTRATGQCKRHSRSTYTKGDVAGFVPACTEDAALVPGRKVLYPSS